MCRRNATGENDEKDSVFGKKGVVLRPKTGQKRRFAVTDW
jgi:hypothetical protein